MIIFQDEEIFYAAPPPLSCFCMSLSVSRYQNKRFPPFGENSSLRGHFVVSS